MSEIELKPCPFCGGKVRYAKNYRYRHIWHDIVCNYCGITNTYDDERQSVRSWNTRPIEDALQSRAEKAEAMVEHLIEAGNALKQHAAKIKSGYVAHDCKLWTDIVEEWRKEANDD